MALTAKISHRRNTVPPVKTAQLMAALGPTKTAQQLGVSTTMLHKARQMGEVSRVVEVAAASVLEHLPSETLKPEKPAPRVRQSAEVMFLIATPRENAPLVEKFAQVLGAEIVMA